MRRLGMAAALLFVAGWLVVGCFGTGPVLHPTGAECGGISIDDAATCEGGLCLVLPQNQQNMSGLCLAECTVETDCNPHEHCETIPNGTFCLRACATDDDCYDAFVCRPFSAGSQRRYCSVDPL
jgi:hypothetical protein